MRILAALAAIAALTGTLVALSSTSGATAPTPTAVMLHGWIGWGDQPADWGDQGEFGTLKAELEAQGYEVRAPLLPGLYRDEGDVVANAQALEDYLLAEGLSNVVLIGHSMGGLTVVYYRQHHDASVLAEPSVLLDSNPWDGGLSGFRCFFGPPDGCEGSDVKAAIAAAGDPGGFLLSVSVGGTSNPYDDCEVVVGGTHNGMIADPDTAAAILAVLAGSDPCNPGPPTSTPTAEPTSTPTATPSPTSTSTPVPPTPTATPTPAPVLVSCERVATYSDGSETREVLPLTEC